MRKFFIGYFVGAVVATVGACIGATQVIEEIRKEKAKADWLNLCNGLEIGTLKMEVQILQRKLDEYTDKSDSN